MSEVKKQKESNFCIHEIIYSATYAENMAQTALSIGAKVNMDDYIVGECIYCKKCKKYWTSMKAFKEELKTMGDYGIK